MLSKLKIYWLDLVTCYGCSHSFLNHPEFSSFLDEFEILYHPILPFSDFEAEDIDVLIIEGAVNNLKRKGIDINELLQNLIEKSKKIIAFGTCSCFGGIFGKGVECNKINIPGCPPHPEWLMYVLNMMKKGKDIKVDEYLRPVEIFSYTTHMGCIRNEYFEWKIDAEDFGSKEGCLFYYQGCQGPFTHSSCNKTLWNEVNSKPRAGTPCFGCTEPTFPKENLFKTETFMGIPANIPLGVSKRAYLTISGIAKSLKNERLSSKLFRNCDENK